VKRNCERDASPSIASSKKKELRCDGRGPITS
jgi:hypothetical protein